MLRLNRETAALRVCIDTLERQNALNISGRVVSRRLREPMRFSSVSSLLFQLDAVMDAQNYPQAFEQARSFTAVKPLPVPAAAQEDEMTPPEVVSAAEGQVSTFTLYVFTRRKSTWQGCIFWSGDTQGQEFESVLELLKLLDLHANQAEQD